MSSKKGDSGLRKAPGLGKLGNMGRPPKKPKLTLVLDKANLKAPTVGDGEESLPPSPHAETCPPTVGPTGPMAELVALTEKLQPAMGKMERVEAILGLLVTGKWDRACLEKYSALWGVSLHQLKLDVGEATRHVRLSLGEGEDFRAWILGRLDQLLNDHEMDGELQRRILSDMARIGGMEQNHTRIDIGVESWSRARVEDELRALGVEVHRALPGKAT